MSSSQDAAQRAHLSLMTQLQECAAAACQPVSTAPAPARATTPSNHVAGRLKPRHERAAAARQPASAAPAQAIGVAKVAESFARLLKSASMTPPQDRFIQAHPGQAALRSIVAAAASCWGDAVSALKDLPAAAANGATSHELYFAGMACLSECMKASMLCPLTYKRPTAVSAQHGTQASTAGMPELVATSPVRKYLVDDLKVFMCWCVDRQGKRRQKDEVTSQPPCTTATYPCCAHDCVPDCSCPCTWPKPSAASWPSLRYTMWALSCATTSKTY